MLSWEASIQLFWERKRWMIFSTAGAETECTSILTSIKKLGFKWEISQLGRKPDTLTDHGQGWEVCELRRVLLWGAPGWAWPWAAWDPGTQPVRASTYLWNGASSRPQQRLSGMVWLPNRPKPYCEQSRAERSNSAVSRLGISFLRPSQTPTSTGVLVYLGVEAEFSGQKLSSQFTTAADALIWCGSMHTWRLKSWNPTLGCSTGPGAVHWCCCPRHCSSSAGQTPWDNSKPQVKTLIKEISKDHVGSGPRFCNNKNAKQVPKEHPWNENPAWHARFAGIWK